VLVHNGNLTNTDALRKEMFEPTCRHINTDSDSEVLLNVFAHELEQSARNCRCRPRHVQGGAPRARALAAPMR
jgi:amidophosphoribosyltransferase